MNNEKCNCCGRKASKRGWDNAPYCSESCERSGVSDLHGSMPGCTGNWLPIHVNREISNRWKD